MGKWKRQTGFCFIGLKWPNATTETGNHLLTGNDLLTDNDLLTRLAKV